MFSIGAPEVILVFALLVVAPAIILGTLWATGVFRNKPR